MRGFDYVMGKPVNRSIREWRTLAQGVIRNGGFLREDRALGETFITRIVREGKHRRPEIVAEVYDINLKLETK